MKSFFKIGIAYDVKEDYKLDSEDWKYSDFSTLAEVQYVKRLFEKRDHSVVLLGNYEEIYNLLKNNTFPAVDVVFNMAEGIGSRNRESWIPSLLEINGIPFTGSDAFALSLPIETFREIIDNYNTAYGLSVSPKVIIDIGMQAKIFKQTDDMHIYFANKNYFAYFIAKHLILSAQNDPPSTDGIQYALKNICFGINSDIILFVSYLLNNTQVIMSILNEADSLLSPWPEVSLDNKNISLLAVASASKEITPPTADEQQEYSEQKETLEERHYSGDEVEARGLFDYDDSEIDKYPYRLIRAIRYTEMICRALPAFHSRLKVSQKSEIIDFIYSYPRKIIYALLRPIDTHIDELCDMLLAYAAETGKKKSDGSDYTHDDFQNMFFDYARAASLSLYNHFAEICTSPKTTQKLVERDSTDAIEKIARLLIIENSGNTDELLKEAEAVIKHSKDMNTRIMAQIVVRKHLLYNKKLSFSKKQQLVDRIFGKSARKTLLSPSRTL